MTVKVVDLGNLPRDLAARFVDGDGVLWTGAGVSAKRKESDGKGGLRQVGVPGAEELSALLIGGLRSKSPLTATLENVAMIFEADHGRAALDDVILQTYGNNAAAAPRYYELVAALPLDVKVFVTTNYDPFLERALDARKPVLVIRERGLNAVTQARPAIYKVHGDALQPSGCVITAGDYVRWEREDPDLSAVLVGLFLQKSVVAIGYRAQDGHFQRLLNRINAGIRSRGETPHAMYVVVPGPDLADFAVYRGPEYDLVLVPATGDQFLEWLQASMAEVGRERLAAAVLERIDNPGVRRAREQLRKLHETGIATGAAEELDARVALCSELEASGRWQEALLERALYANALHAAGRDADAAREHIALFEDAVWKARDVELIGTLDQRVLQHRSGTGRFAAPTHPRYFYIRALADTQEGLPETGAAEVAEAERLLSEGGTEFACELVELRAHAAVTNHEYSRAGEHFLVLAGLRGGSDAEVARVYGLFFNGLSSRSSEVRDSLEHLAVSSSNEPLRLRALGWLATLDGDIDLAQRHFEGAALRSVDAGDLKGAEIGFRAIFWAENYFPGFRSAGFERRARSYEAKAALESFGGAEGFAKTFLHRADRELRRERLREASVAAHRALRVAFEDCDPEAAHVARQVLAEVWAAVLERAPRDSWTLSWSCFAAMSAGAWVRPEVLSRLLETIKAALQSGHAVPDILALANKLLGAARSQADVVGLVHVTSALYAVLGRTIADQIVAPVVERAIDWPWTTHKALDTRGVAGQLVLQSVKDLSPENRNRLIEKYASWLPTLPPRFRDDALRPLGALLDQGTIGAELAESLSASLMRFLTDDKSSEDAVYMTAAVLIQRAPAESVRPLRALLLQKGDEGHWYALEWLARFGVELPTESLQRYLDDVIARMRALDTAADPRSISFGATGGMRELLRAGSDALPAEKVVEALEAGTALLRQDQQHGVIRATWLPSIVYLAQGKRDYSERVLPVLLTLSRGEYSQPPSPFDGVGDHPLSNFRMSTSNVGLREGALVATGALFASVGEESRYAIVQVISAACQNADPNTRRSGINAIQYVYDGIVGTKQSGNRQGADTADVSADTQMSLEELLNVAVRCLFDPDATVREAATEMLRYKAQIAAKPDAAEEPLGAHEATAVTI
jgi:hypothetical protein